jgi:ParB family transcriptional regulator, chromosome partitioning protein
MVKRPVVPKMRGVDDLLTMTVDAPTNSVAIDLITLPESQPRRFFDPDKLAQLAESIKEHGILEPPIVRRVGEKYQLVAGERRLRAAQILGLSEIPIICKDLSDEQALQVSLIENLQREDLNPIEETEAILQLLAISIAGTTADVVSILNQSSNAKKRNLELTDNVIRQLKTMAIVFDRVGRFNPESFRTNRLPLLKLPEDVLTALRQGQLEFTKARAIAKIKDDLQRQELLTATIENNLPLTAIKQQIATQSVDSAEPTLRERSAPTLPPMQTQIDRALRSVKQAQVWTDPKKQKRLEELLAELEQLMM